MASALASWASALAGLASGRRLGSPGGRFTTRARDAGRWRGKEIPGREELRAQAAFRGKERTREERGRWDRKERGREGTWAAGSHRGLLPRILFLASGGLLPRITPSSPADCPHGPLPHRRIASSAPFLAGRLLPRGFFPTGHLLPRVSPPAICSRRPQTCPFPLLDELCTSAISPSPVHPLSPSRLLQAHSCSAQWLVHFLFTSAIELQRFARRVVSLCASSSGCERNWSSFEFIHTKKRNRFLHKRLNSIVFVSYKRKMKSRFQKIRQKKGKAFDPLVIEEFDWNNEWTDSLHVAPQGCRGCECDLTWELVDEALGASEALRGRNLPRRAHYKRARNSTPNVLEGDLGSDNEEEEENQDPYDDADVTDQEDDPNDTNGGGEDTGAANTPGEFDDDY